MRSPRAAFAFQRLRLTNTSDTRLLGPPMKNVMKGLLRLLGSLTLAAAAVGCTGLPVHQQSPVDEGLMSQLQSQSLNFKQIGLLDRKGELHFSGRWDAPASVTVPMELRGGLPSVQCRINGGSPQWMIIDTGSQGCVMEAQTAVDHRVQIIDPAMTDLKIIGVLGSESALMGVPQSFSVGGWQVYQFPFLVRTQKNRLLTAWPFGRTNLEFDVLGMSMISSMCSYLTLDYVAGKATFGFKGSYTAKAGNRSWHCPLSFTKRLPHVDVRSNGRDWHALIDTGATSVAEMNQGTAKGLGLLQSARQISGSRLGVGTSTAKPSTIHKVVTIPAIEKLGPKILNVPALVVGDFNKIGTGMLRPFRVTLDFKAQRLWLEDPQ